MNSFAWYNLVPSGLDGMRTLITAGGSQISYSDYVAAAAAPDGTRLVAYIPPDHNGTITVDMGAMGGPSQARWFDPTSATYIGIGTGLPNSGTRTFNPPGNNSVGETDWVLLIETGSPAQTPSPTPAATTTPGASASPTARVSPTVAPSSTPIGGLVAAYSFDEGTGTTVNDASGHGLTGIIQGATWTTAGRHGNALSFNGISSYVDLGNPALLQMTGSITVSAWVNAADNPPDDGQIVAKSDSSSGWQLKTSSDAGPQTFGIAVSSPSNQRTQRYSNTIRSLGVWYHVAGVYNAAAGTLNVYVNGALDNGVLSGAIPTSNLDAPVNANIGRRNGGFYFNGIVDDVRIYNRALSISEIQNDMATPVGTPGSTPTATSTATATATATPTPTPTATATATPTASVAVTSTPTPPPSSPTVTPTSTPTAGLIAAYSFDEGSGTTVSDASGHGINGVIQGADWTSAGRHGSALSFDGTSSYVDLGNPSLLQLTGSFTLSAWVKATGNPADDGQIVAKSDSASGWQLKTSPDTGPQTFGVAVSSGTGQRTQRYSTTVRTLGVWYHVAGVYDSGARMLDIYVNGVRDDGVLMGAIPASNLNSAVNVNIGRRSGGFYFNGVIDDVRIYNRALTQAEVQADMNTPVSSN